jgi:hypothetical protein
MVAHMGEMMGSGPMAADDHSESMNTEMEHENDDTRNGESSHQEWVLLGCISGGRALHHWQGNI